MDDVIKLNRKKKNLHRRSESGAGGRVITRPRERKTGYPTRAQHNAWERKWRAEKKAQGLVLRRVKGHWIWAQRKSKSGEQP